MASHAAGGKRQPADLSRAGIFEGSRGTVVRHLRRDGASGEMGVEGIPALTAASPGGSGRIACGKIRREERYRADCYAVVSGGSAVTARTAAAGALLVLLSVLAGLLFAWAFPLPTVENDASGYFSLARNVDAAKGFTVDGVLQRCSARRCSPHC